nr:hypothetical protein GCM10020092_053140 [Actinoplanes digitatis]
MSLKWMSVRRPRSAWLAEPVVDERREQPVVVAARADLGETLGDEAVCQRRGPGQQLAREVVHVCRLTFAILTLVGLTLVA